ELIGMLRDTLPKDLPVVFISSVSGYGLDELKDVLWKELNNESNKLLDITSEDTLVHRDKDMTRFLDELKAEGEDEDITVVSEEDIVSMDDDLDDVEDLDDYEFVEP
ncbi:MAG: GTPase ObgE, partial [Prevotella sp.]|nr:GTPase ObgE [Prevotella sp.]